MSHYSPMEEKHHHREIMQLLNNPHAAPSSSSQPPSLDLQLSISVSPLMKKPPPQDHQCVLIRKVRKYNKDNDHVMKNMDSYNSSGGGGVEYLKWEAAEQIRLAAMEKAYAERVREMTRREMEMAQSEFARAHSMWERAREEVERAERMKERANALKIDSTCMEITCLSCRQNFRP